MSVCRFAVFAALGLFGQSGFSQIEKPGDPNAKFEKSLATIHALLVRPLSKGGHAAQAMKLSATAVKGRADGQIGFRFNQAVGNDMRTSMNEVVRAMQVKHGALPANMEVEFGFADKWGGKDGPSAAVATALLIESLLEGFEIPPQVAVTGDLNANQNVQPVGGVPDKIRGAMTANCQVIGVPAGNEADLNDMVVEENLRRFLTAKIFTMGTLDEALILVDADSRNDSQKTALAEFEAIQKDLASGGAKALYAPAMQARLNGVLESIPNLYSAKILLAASRRTMPTRYSLAGTLVRIDEAMAPFGTVLLQLRRGAAIEKFKFGRNNPLTEAQNGLRALRNKSDKRLVPVIEAQATMLDRLQRLINSNANNRTVLERLLGDFQEADKRANAEWKKVVENQAIQDQLMKRGINFDSGE